MKLAESASVQPPPVRQHILLEGYYGSSTEKNVQLKAFFPGYISIQN